jgi:LPXTG-site transpeptidase (sortase) family protein
MKFIAKLLIILGVVCYAIGIYLIWERNNPNRLALGYEESYKDADTSNLPVRIIIKDVGIDLPIYPAKTNNGKWETTSKGASYLVSSPIPGEVGNSVIYAHDWVSLFGPLKNARPGNMVEIEYADKTKKDFVVGSTAVVPYNKSDILSSTEDRRITLYTCTGFFDSERFVAVALLN